MSSTTVDVSVVDGCHLRDAAVRRARKPAGSLAVLAGSLGGLHPATCAAVLDMLAGLAPTLHHGGPRAVLGLRTRTPSTRLRPCGHRQVGPPCSSRATVRTPVCPLGCSSLSSSQTGPVGTSWRLRVSTFSLSVRLRSHPRAVLLRPESYNSVVRPHQCVKSRMPQPRMSLYSLYITLSRKGRQRLPLREWHRALESDSGR